MSLTHHEQDEIDSLLFVTKRPNLVMAKGQGMVLWDTTGKQYLDFIGGWAVTSLGHCPEVVQKVLTEQAATLLNASPAFYNDKMLEYAELLTSVSCFDRAFFGSTGSEVNEGAIKLARKYGAKHKNGAYEIISTIGSFHGRTLATMSATGKKMWKDLFEPKVTGFKHVPFNDLEAIRSAITPKTCAIMLEPIQGEGGVNAASQEYIAGLRSLCDEHDVLLIFDEVQTGFGRTGTLFAYEHYGVEPDIMTLAKGIGSGFPLAALLTTEKYNIFDPGDQGGTYTGQPLAMAVGIAVLREIMDKKICEHVVKMGEYFQTKLRDLQTDYPISKVRGYGLLIACDVAEDKGPDIVERCLDNGLILNSPSSGALRFIPPLIVEKFHIDEMMSLLREVLTDVYS